MARDFLDRLGDAFDSFVHAFDSDDDFGPTEKPTASAHQQQENISADHWQRIKLHRDIYARVIGEKVTHSTLAAAVTEAQQVADQATVQYRPYEPGPRR